MTKEREKGFLSEEEWRTIIYYIYNEEDASFLENKILEEIIFKRENIYYK